MEAKWKQVPIEQIQPGQRFMLHPQDMAEYEALHLNGDKMLVGLMLCITSTPIWSSTYGPVFVRSESAQAVTQ